MSFREKKSNDVIWKKRIIKQPQAEPTNERNKD
jgi:hypothetical protein